MTISALEIVPMRARHARAVLRIEAMVNPKPWSAEVLRSELEQVATRRYFVAIQRNVVVGFGGLMIAVDDGHVTNIGVHPDWQRRGIASRLMLTIAQTARELNAIALTLEVRMSNKSAQELYRHFGFAPVGARKAYYQQPDEDALIMWARDIQLAEYKQLLDQYVDRFSALDRDEASSVRSGQADATC